MSKKFNKKLYQDYMCGYRHSLSNIQIGIDDTDHICFFCPKCKKPCRVVKVRTDKILTTWEDTTDKCTWVLIVCDVCQKLGQRKFYWNTEDGKFCWQKTFNDNKSNGGKNVKGIES